MSESNASATSRHWPMICLAVLVVVIFVISMVTFQVQETEYAIIKTFGKPKVDANGQVLQYTPGLHFRMPFIDQVWRHDKRIQCYELTKGQHEQVTTKDEYQIIVSTYILWRVGDPALFLKRLNSTSDAEEKLDAVVRNARVEVIPQYNFADMVNTESSQAKMDEIENQMLAKIKDIAMREYGIEITKIGFRQLGFPEAVSTKVFDRMKAERASKAEKYLAEGMSTAQRIRSEADRNAASILAEAEAEAKRIRGRGDETAAKHYAVFSKNPELAKFLRSLEALKASLGENDTLILDTDTPPFSLLKSGATELGPNKKQQD